VWQKIEDKSLRVLEGEGIGGGETMRRPDCQTAGLPDNRKESVDFEIKGLGDGGIFGWIT
jgi:hypothetical protein